MKNVNEGLPYIMHIDLNSCFAIIEQQANRFLRGRSVAISAYDTPGGMVIASSYEAKAKGIKLGVNNFQARQLDPRVMVLTPDPPKYRAAHIIFRDILLQYTPDIVPKSIDEFVLDFTNSHLLQQRKSSTVQARSLYSGGGVDSKEEHNVAMLEIGREIKQKIREKLGEWVTVNIGIGTNRFLAKYAAGFGKPDGMTLIDHHNLLEMYDGMKLIDLPGINIRYRARLRQQQIYTPLDFLDADMRVLQKQVFKSIHGRHWYLRLRGYEVDAIEFTRKSIGHQYALSKKTMEMVELEKLLMKLCEKVGRRLRQNSDYASGIHVFLGFASNDQGDGPSSFENMHNIRSWHHGEKVAHRLYSTLDIYEAAKRLLHIAEITNNVRIMSVHVYGLVPWDPEQLSIFEQINEERITDKGKVRITAVSADMRAVAARKRTSDAVDAINNRYGEFVITPALITDMQGTILDRIAFGQVSNL